MRPHLLQDRDTFEDELGSSSDEDEELRSDASGEAGEDSGSGRGGSGSDDEGDSQASSASERSNASSDAEQPLGRASQHGSDADSGGERGLAPSVGGATTTTGTGGGGPGRDVATVLAQGALKQQAAEQGGWPAWSRLGSAGVEGGCVLAGGAPARRCAGAETPRHGQTPRRAGGAQDRKDAARLPGHGSGAQASGRRRGGALLCTWRCHCRHGCRRARGGIHKALGRLCGAVQARGLPWPPWFLTAHPRPQLTHACSDEDGAAPAVSDDEDEGLDTAGDLVGLGPPDGRHRDRGNIPPAAAVYASFFPARRRGVFAGVGACWSVVAPHPVPRSATCRRTWWAP